MGTPRLKKRQWLRWIDDIKSTRTSKDSSSKKSVMKKLSAAEGRILTSHRNDRWKKLILKISQTMEFSLLSKHLTSICSSRKLLKLKSNSSRRQTQNGSTLWTLFTLLIELTKKKMRVKKLKKTRKIKRMLLMMSVCMRLAEWLSTARKFQKMTLRSSLSLERRVVLPIFSCKSTCSLGRISLNSPATISMISLQYDYKSATNAIKLSKTIPSQTSFLIFIFHTYILLSLFL